MLFWRSLTLIEIHTTRRPLGGFDIFINEGDAQATAHFNSCDWMDYADVRDATALALLQTLRRTHDAPDPYIPAADVARVSTDLHEAAVRYRR